MGHGLLHQSNTSGRIGTVLARSKDSHGLGEKVGAGGITLRGDARRDQADLLYLEVRRGTQVAQGRGLQILSFHTGARGFNRLQRLNEGTIGENRARWAQFWA